MPPGFLYSSTDLCYLCLTVSLILVSVLYSNFKFSSFQLASYMPDKLPMNRETEIKLRWHMHGWNACWFMVSFDHSFNSQFTRKWRIKEIKSTMYMYRMSPPETDAPASSLNSNLTCLCVLWLQTQQIFQRYGKHTTWKQLTSISSIYEMAMLRNRK